MPFPLEMRRERIETNSKYKIQMMKKFTTYFVLLMIIFIGMANNLNAQNQVSNPGFESWTTGAPDNWSTSGGAITLTQNTVNTHGGTSSCEVVFTSQSNQNLMSASFAVTPGQEINGGIWILDNDDAGRGRISVLYDGGENFYGDYSEDNAEWQELTFTETVPAGATSAQFQIRFYDVSANWVDDCEILVDDALFEVNTSVNPEPSNYPSSFSSTFERLNAAISWTDSDGTNLPSGYLLKGSTSNNITAPVDGTIVENDSDFSDGSIAINVFQGDEGFDLSMQHGLIFNQDYYFKIYPFSNSGNNIDYKTDGTAPSANGTTTDLTLVHQEYFAEDLGTWSQLSVIGDEVWEQSTSSGNSYVEMSGYNGSAVDNEDWLISPALNLSTFSNIVLSFSSAFNYSGPDLALYYSSDYSGTGDPNSATWDELTPIWSDGAFNWVGSGNLDLPSTNGIFLAYKYLSNPTDGAAKWEITNILITAGGGAAAPATQLDITSINGGNAVYENQAFTVTVQAQDDDGAAANVDANLAVTLSLGTGSGNLGGTLTGTIASGTSTITISGVSYSPFENGVVLEVEGGSLTSGTSNAFDVLEVIIPEIVISEIMYKAMGGSEDSLEYIEFYNNGSSAINLENYMMTKGVVHTFGNVSIDAGAYLLLARDADAVLELLGVNAEEWTSNSLSNGGEEIELSDPLNNVVAYVDYETGDWPTTETGKSIRFCNTTLINNDPVNWSISEEFITTIGEEPEIQDIYGSPLTGCGAASVVANFESNTSSVYEGQSVTFTDLSTGNPTTWAWVFEGGTPATSSEQNPAVVYNTPGNYDVTLTAGNGTSTDEKLEEEYIEVLAMVADFEADNTSIIGGESVNFTDLSIGSATSWDWTFAGGTPATSTSQNPTNIVYDTPGNYDVVLTISRGGFSDTETKTAYILVGDPNEPPVANFSADETTIFVGQSVQFTSLSTNNPTTFTWTFEEGTPATSDMENPNIVYNTAGTFNVTLYVENSVGNDEMLKSEYITVLPMNADFEADIVSLNMGGSVNFTDLSTGEPSDWEWTFTGGTPASSTSQNPSNIVYNTAGVYTVSLTISRDANSATETKTAYIEVIDPSIAPVADFEANQTMIFVGQTVVFTDLSANEPLTWEWTFDGGTPASSNQQNPSVVYNTAGTYDVSLLVENTAGNNELSMADYITVLPATVGDLVITEIMYNPPESGDDSLEYIEIYNNSAEIVNLLGYALTDGIEYTFPSIELAINDYLVVAKSADAMLNTFGITTSEWTSGSLSNGGELIRIISPTGITVDSVPFSDTTPWPEDGDGTGPSITICDPEAENSVGETWHASVNYLADNASGDAIYGTPGTAPVALANFTANDQLPGTGDQVEFTELSTCNAETFTWTFEGGTPETSTDLNPIITYSMAGDFDVTLTVTNAIGSHTITMEEYIRVGVGIAEQTLSEISIMPNPSTGLFTLENPSNNEISVMIYNVLGKLVYKNNTVLSNEVIDLTREESGIYLLQLSIDGEYKTMRIIKQ